MTAHYAVLLDEARQRLMDKVAGNLRAWLEGEAVNVVV
jgi:lactate dehydrogenase-like 2-hydroxyacid dehydrogenase